MSERYHGVRDLDKALKINKHTSSSIIPNRYDHTKAISDKKRRENLAVSVRDVKAWKNMQVSDVYAHMRGLGILSLDAISLMEVTAQILVLL